MIKPLKTSKKIIDVSFFYNLKDYKNHEVIYSHSVFDVNMNQQRLMYIGCCPFNELFNASDARTNKAWREYVSGSDNVKLEIISTFDNPVEAHKELFRLVKELRPWCNINGQRDKSHGRVRCVTDGREFDKAIHACDYYDISSSSLSSHLRGRKGYASIRGLTFERIYENE